MPDVLDREIYDEIVDVEFDDAIRVARDLGTQEGILGGISSGAIVWGLSSWPSVPRERRQS